MFSYLNKKSLRVFEFRDSYVLYMFYRYEHYMSISHMAVIVALVKIAMLETIWQCEEQSSGSFKNVMSEMC